MRGNEDSIYLKDYAPSPFLIEKVDLEVEIAPGTARVRSFLTIVPREDTAPGTPLVLDGEELALESIAIDGLPLPLTAYDVTPTSLTILEPPPRRFVLETEVTLKPEDNQRLMGLYRSNGTWCTQCEPEGFRRITFYPDRPDVLARFRVRMIADPVQAPVLLANGNLVETGEMPDGRHYAVWLDPHPKPAYLFAMVGGDLGSIHDTFTTASGRHVSLAIYCEHGKEEQCRYAMDSLKRAMAWDERRFGREYDLDVFNIVAVSDFNFGAMENKGLNIFNDKLVFARPESATDADYMRIESVIAHEYFHNWTGNRITCRDWFQLCLKEGLTVYRDQEFTMDERSRPVARIEDVRSLRAIQFPEDGGPLAHPARPDQYREINNFYTATVYEKGAEIVRMLATLLGEDGFRKGMDLYFERHDGDATTIESFIRAFEDATQRDLQHFAQWYLQAGTPEVTVRDRYDEGSQTYELTLSQTVAPSPGQPEKQPMVLPIRFGLVGPNGSPMGWTAVTGGEVVDDLIVLDAPQATLRFEGVANRPVPSLFRQFSAPVTVVSDATQEDRLFLARHDEDPFNRWQALQDVAMTLLVEAAEGTAWTDSQRSGLAQALEDTATSDALDDAFKALALTLPSVADVARVKASDVDPSRINQLRVRLTEEIVGDIGATLESVYAASSASEPYAPTAAQTGRRALRNTALALLTRGGRGGDLAAAQYQTASNMTDRLAALSAAVETWTPEAQAMLGDFRTMHATDPLVFDKWLTLNTLPDDPATLERVKAILAEPDFPRNNPNRLRALVGSFANGNLMQFTRPDGAGFRFVTAFVAEVDQRNPQVAARVLTAFRIWRSLEPQRRVAAESALKSLQDTAELSRNSSDILSRTLAA
ncbi:MAG TPA: aminopeptidase N [Devosiaceae bacterium]|jgi:aminopeptidase N|nr:aminopeptidase N [Devosiaceae bacterium]